MYERGVKRLTMDKYLVKNCKLCGKKIPKKQTGRLPYYCNGSHRTTYYQKLKLSRFKNSSPEDFIRRELSGLVRCPHCQKRFWI